MLLIRIIQDFRGRPSIRIPSGSFPKDDIIITVYIDNVQMIFAKNITVLEIKRGLRRLCRGVYRLLRFPRTVIVESRI